MIGAGSIVNKDVPEYKVVVGVPAKIIKQVEIDVINNKWTDF